MKGFPLEFGIGARGRVYFKRGVQPKCGLQNEKFGVQNSIWSVDSQDKMHQNPKFGCGSAPDPAGGATAPPDPLAGFNGAYF